MDTSQWFYGRDGVQQGPISGDELKRLAESGGLRPHDLVWREGMPQWQPAQQVPGLFAAPAGPPPIPARPGAGAPAPHYAPPGHAPPPAHYAPPPAGYAPARPIGEDAGIRMLLPVGRSVWAIAAGYLGLFSVLLIPAPLALIVSIIAIRDIKKHPDRHGMGRAIFGLIMGVLGTIFLVVMMVSIAGHSGGSGRRY
jgi:hypothetical protein